MNCNEIIKLVENFQANSNEYLKYPRSGGEAFICLFVCLFDSTRRLSGNRVSVELIYMRGPCRPR